MEIRSYVAADAEGCLAVFESNWPRYFAESERERFAAFLASGPGTYYVMEHEGRVLGCGGWAKEDEPGLVRLTWGMVSAELHRKGLGRLLLIYRLKEIGKQAGVERVRMETTQHVAGFFERAGGFRVVATEPDGYRAGLDRVTMVKRLAVCE